MAQSSSGNNWGVYLDRDLSENGHGISVSWRGGFYSEGWNFEINGTPFAWDFNGGGSVTQSISCGMHVYTQMASGSFWIAKGHSAFTYQMKAWCDRTGAGQYKPGYAEVYNNISVPQLEHHQYTFDANGGSGAPGQVTKWYGEQLAIPSAKPTRKNYSFLGWAHSKTATTPEYSSGNSYWTPDEDTTLYAVWHLDYVAPKITAMTALRAGDTKGTAAPLGTYGYISCTFAKGTNNVTKVTVSDTLKKTWAVSGTTSGASGTFTAYAALAATEETDVTVSVTDGSGTTIQTRHIGTSTPPIDVGLKGTAVGILASATKAGLTLPGTRYCLGQQELPVLYYTSKPDEGSVPCKPCLIVVKGGATYLYE